jgi:hypothetical protein
MIFEKVRNRTFSAAVTAISTSFEVPAETDVMSLPLAVPMN